MNRRSFFGALLAIIPVGAAAVSSRKVAGEVNANLEDLSNRVDFIDGGTIWIENPDRPGWGVEVYRTARIQWEQV